MLNNYSSVFISHVGFNSLQDCQNVNNMLGLQLMLPESMWEWAYTCSLLVTMGPDIAMNSPAPALLLSCFRGRLLEFGRAGLYEHV